jgi:tetratricopeptide (TPR) repeat protein
MDDLLYTFDDYARLCAHPYTHVRKWAFEHLCTQYADQAGAVVNRLVADPDEEIAVTALLFVQRERVRGAESSLLALLADGRERVAREATDAVGELRCEEAVPALAEHLRSPKSDEHLIGVARALAGIGGPGHRELAAMLADEELDPFEHEVAFDALTHDPTLSQLPLLVEVHLRVSAAEEPRHYTQHLASEAECHQLWADLSRPDGAHLSDRLQAAAETLGHPLEELASEELRQQAAAVGWADVPAVAEAILGELSRLEQEPPAALELGAPQWRRTAYCRATLIRELAPRLHADDQRPLETRQQDAALLLASLVLLRVESFHAHMPADGPERLDSIVRNLLTEDGPPVDDFIEEMAHRAEEYANRLCGLFDPEDESWASGYIAQVVTRTPRDRKHLWEPLIPDLVKACRPDVPGMLTTWAVSALQWLGPVVLDEVAAAFERDEVNRRETLLGVLQEIPTQRSFELIRDHFEDLTEEYEDWPIEVLTALGNPDALELLDPEFIEEDFALLEAMVVLSDVNGKEQPDLDKLRTRYVLELENRRAAAEDEAAPLAPLHPDEPVQLRLLCGACGQSRLYEVERVLLAGGDEQAPVHVYLTEDVGCLACGVTGDLAPAGDATGGLVERLRIAFASGHDLGRLMRRVVPVDPYDFEGAPMTPLAGLTKWRERADANPADEDAHLGLARTLRLLWRTDEAQTAAERALGLNPAGLHARLVLAEVAECRGDKESAQQQYRELLGRARRSHEPGWREIVRLTEQRLEERESAPEPVREARETGSVGRNDPCPCGSGKKYKKCCLGKG